MSLTGLTILPLFEIDPEIEKAFYLGQRFWGHYRSNQLDIRRSTYKTLSDKGAVAGGDIYREAFFLGWKDGYDNGNPDVYPYSDRVLEILNEEIETVVNQFNRSDEEDAPS